MLRLGAMVLMASAVLLVPSGAAAAGPLTLAPAARASAASTQASVGANICSGYSQVTWSQSLLVFEAPTHRLQMGCGAAPGVARVQVTCASDLYRAGQAVDGGAQSSGSDRCDAVATSPNTYLTSDNTFVHSVYFRLTLIPSNPKSPVVWGGSSNLCSGQGTATVTCAETYGATAGTAVTRNYS